ncbi:tetratricopeptide repeat protein [Flavobacterium sp. UBA6195]|uniref:tetratricopeptide repeat protein n=1 Tax=Flavobacterium sp. UBA6195 TaxID=1946554 RepID=UPI0011DB7C2E|nr:tetratricopeptide repeat protein [Flavobacterium sp. UBA6195]TXI67555.1 MAG: tetratricopeptide repeat protein [Flavobacterium sp.]
MKKSLTLLFIATASFFSQAQNTEACTEAISLMTTSVKAKDVNSYDYLTTLRKDCPTFHKSIYTYGELAIKLKIEKATTPQEKEKYVRDLLKLYDEHDQYFPGNGAGNKMKKGLALFDNKIGTTDEVYNLLDVAFKTDYANFKYAKAMYVYFEILVNKHKANSGIELQQVFDKYDDLTKKLEEEEKELTDEKDALLSKEESGQTLTDKETARKNRLENNLEIFEGVRNDMDNIILELSTCAKLIPFYQKGFEQNKTNEEWLKRATNRLDAKGCDSDPLFSKMSEALYKLNPSAEAAEKLGVVEYQRKNTAKAMEYFNQAASLHTDNTKKANLYYKIATLYSRSNKAQARNYARKALEVKPSFGKSYLLIASLYGSSINDCGNDQFEKRAVYWLAAQYCDKAASVDSTLRSKASGDAAKYRAAAPSKTEIFQSGKGGQRIAFNCWIGESILVPSL